MDGPFLCNRSELNELDKPRLFCRVFCDDETCVYVGGAKQLYSPISSVSVSAAQNYFHLCTHSTEKRCAQHTIVAFFSYIYRTNLLPFPILYHCMSITWLGDTGQKSIITIVFGYLIIFETLNAQIKFDRGHRIIHVGKVEHLNAEFVKAIEVNSYVIFGMIEV